MTRANLQIFHGGRWHHAGELEFSPAQQPRGTRGAAAFAYHDDYFTANAGETGQRAASCRLPVTLEFHDLSHWPSFLLDLLPSGAGRRFWLQQLGRPNVPASDVELLLRGAGNPPGNLRIAEAVYQGGTYRHAGFSRDEVVAANEGFIDYAERHGAPVAGSSGAAGDAPKFLLTQDRQEGNWHADGVLPDSRALQHWLVKFPRGRTAADLQVLRHEPCYLAVARHFGLRVHAVPEYIEGALFVPRFDRSADNGQVERLGLETAASLAGIFEFGTAPRHELLARALAASVTEPASALREYVLRDLLNLALGNTDNHPRNTSVLKHRDGTVTISPLYDFAPMFLDPQGIARVSRWNDEPDGIPNWNYVCTAVTECGGDGSSLRDELAHKAEAVRELPAVLATAGGDGEVIQRRMRHIEQVAKTLEQLRE